ncbi:hypothetical protein Barb6_00043 [Bacteroidales bacterium Barb6]|nr:hypothetical protein Barb6_00043 [Bacteroidales bacterium Barb6]
MEIQDKMYSSIEQEINQTIEAGKERVIVDYDKAKQVAQRLTQLATDKRDANMLINEYIVSVKNICNSKK